MFISFKLLPFRYIQPLHNTRNVSLKESRTSILVGKIMVKQKKQQLYFNSTFLLLTTSSFVNRGNTEFLLHLGFLIYKQTKSKHSSSLKQWLTLCLEGSQSEAGAQHQDPCWRRLGCRRYRINPPWSWPCLITL